MSYGKIRISMELLQELLAFPKEWRIMEAGWSESYQCIEVTVREDEAALIQLIPNNIMGQVPVVRPILRKWKDGRVQIVGVEVIE